MPVADAPTLAQLLARQGALSPGAVLVALHEVAAAAAAREAAGTAVGPLTADHVRVERTGRTHLLEVAASGDAGMADAAAVVAADAPAGSPLDAPAVGPALARLGIAMLRGGTDGSDDDTTVPTRVRGGAVPSALSRALTRGLAGEFASAAAFDAAIKDIPLRPDERKAALEQLNQLAVRAWTLAPRASGDASAAAAAGRSTSATPAAPPASRRWLIIGALVITTGAAWVEREHLFGASAPEDDGAATLALAKRAQRLRATTDADSLPVEAPTVDSAAVRDSAAARVAGAASSGSQGGEAEASLAGDPLIEGIRALEAGRTREAIPLLKAAAAADAENMAPQGYLACAHRRLGEHKAADQALAKTGGVPGPWTGCARKTGG